MDEKPVPMNIMDLGKYTQTPDEIVDDLFKSLAYYNDQLKTETDPGERRSLQDAKAMITELLRSNAPGGYQMLKRQIDVLRAERDLLKSRNNRAISLFKDFTATHSAEGIENIAFWNGVLSVLTGSDEP